MFVKLTFIVFLAALTTNSLADISSLHYCADMNPQNFINIEQLMGMWYGIEIITHHLDEIHYMRVEPSCPILHISEDKNYPSSTPPPLYKDYNYQHNYGERSRGYERQPPSPTRRYSPPHEHRQPYDGHQQQRYGTVDVHRRGRPADLRRLRIWWDENGSGTEYHLVCNLTQPGFWRSSGPQNGSELEPQFGHFAGTVQVIKAVGNHLVLTFCHQLPDQQLFTIILSRENKLDSTDVHGVHSLLNRRGLSTSAIQKVCSNGANAKTNAESLLIKFIAFGILIIFLKRI